INLSKRIKLILGIDEESGWRCVNHYFKKYPQAPIAGFIPDADFPLIYGEKGITSTIIRGKLDDSRILGLGGGLRANMVPESAFVKVTYDAKTESLWKHYLQSNDLVGSTKKEASELILSVEGKSAHGSLP